MGAASVVCWAGAAARRVGFCSVTQLLDDLRLVCEACCRLMGVQQPAAESYLVILHLVDEGYGGLEHDDSTVLVYGRRNLEKPSGYRRFLQLVAHEYLPSGMCGACACAAHTHRLPPCAGGSKPLVAEGVTSYLDQFLPLSAG